MEGPEAGHSLDPENTDSSTHPVSPSIHVALQAPVSSGLSALDLAAPPDLVAQDPHPPNSLPHSPAEQLSDSLRQSPIHSGSSGWSVDHLQAAEKLALAGSHPSESGQLSPSSSKPSTPVAPCGPPLQHSSDGAPSPDHAEPSLDSSLQLQSREGLSPAVQTVETSVDSTVLDVMLESGAQVPMNQAVYEQLRSEAAKKVVTWNNCLSRMTVNQHPDCEFPHISGVRCDMQYYTKTEIPEMKAQYDEFHDLLLCNDLTEEIVNEMDPFVVCHVVARLHKDEHSIPEELLPSLEASLSLHRDTISALRDEQIGSVKDMDLKLRQLSEEEAVSTIESGNIVPPPPRLRFQLPVLRGQTAGVLHDSQRGVGAQAPSRADQAGGPASCTIHGSFGPGLQ